jgi:hypothetical protein
MTFNNGRLIKNKTNSSLAFSFILNLKNFLYNLVLKTKLS